MRVTAGIEQKPTAHRDGDATLRVLVVTNHWPRDAKPHTGIDTVRQVESLRRAGVEVDLVPISGSLRSYARAAWTVLRLNLARRRAHLLHAYTGHSGVLACLQLRYPVVLTYVGYDIDAPPEDPQWLRRKPERLLFRALSLLVAATIVQSRRQLARLPGPARPRSNVIPSGINRELFSPIAREEARRQLGWGPEPTVLFAADPARHVKRFDLAERTVELVRQEVPDVRLVAAHGVAPDQMPIWMSAADVLILTSRSEGSPNVVKEAMACNLPIVSTDVGDVREVIGGARNCHVRSADAPGLADAVLAVLSALPERSDGRSRSAALGEDLIAQRVLEVYDEACHRGPGALGFLSRPGAEGVKAGAH